MRSFTMVVAVMLASILAPKPMGAAALPLRWSAPVAGPIVEEFRAPAHRYGPGHRGIDFAVAPGTPVGAAAAGLVVFAGPIAGAWHVSIDHGDGVVTSYSFLAGVSVSPGERVGRGTPIGVSGGTGFSHAGDVVHFGLRVDGEYRDPRLLLRRIAPADVVHLDELGR